MHELFKINFPCGFIFAIVTHHLMLQFSIANTTRSLYLYMQYFQAIYQNFEISTIRHLTPAAAPDPIPVSLVSWISKIALGIGADSSANALSVHSKRFVWLFWVSLILSLLIFDGCTNSFNQSVLLLYRRLSHMLSTSLCLVKHQMDGTAV